MTNQSPLEAQLKKGENLPLGWPWRLFALMLIVFLLSIFIYLGMIFGYQPYLNSQAKKLETEIADLAQSVDENRQKQLVGFYSQFINLSSLLNSYKTVSPVFKLIEENTYPSVRYNNLTVNVEERSLTLEGAALDYETLVKELALFEKAPVVEDVSLKNSKLTEIVKGVSEVKFGLKLMLKPEFFKGFVQKSEPSGE